MGSYLPQNKLDKMKKKKTSETSLKEAIKDWCAIHGFECLTIGASPFSTPGLPDRIIVGCGLTVMVEAKSKTGSLSPSQKEMQRKCKEAGILHLVVKDTTDLDCLLRQVKLIVTSGKDRQCDFMITHLKGMEWIIDEDGNKRE